MAKLKINFSDIKNFEKKLRKEVVESQNNLKVGLLKATTLVQKEAINNTKAGIKYVDGIYQTGNLRRSISFDVPTPRYGEVFISKGLKYPLFVEKGTRRMRAKPFLSLALTDNINKIKEILNIALARTITNLKK